MAHTPKTLANAYAEEVYKLYLKCEARIDALLMEFFPKILKDGQITLGVKSAAIGESLIGAHYFPYPYKEAIISLVIEKYKAWGPLFERGDSVHGGWFIFNYAIQQESLLTLFRNIEERFRNMDLSECDGDNGFSLDDYNNDIPF